MHVSLVVHSLPSLQPPDMAVCAQVPPEQVSVVHVLPSSQLMHVPPFEPQFAAASTKHVLPEMQPVQHVPARHWPPVHEPLAATHVPLELQLRHSPQPAQSRPLLPQASSVCSL